MQTIPKQVLGIQLPPQIMEVPIVRRSSTVLTVETIGQVHRVDAQMPTSKIP